MSLIDMYLIVEIIIKNTKQSHLVAARRAENVSNQLRR